MKKVDRSSSNSLKTLKKGISSLGLGAITFFSFCSPILAEGSYQIGSPYQALAEYDSQYDNVGATGLTKIKRPIYVDILSSGEVINVSTCGLAFGDDWSVEIYYVGADMDDFSGTRTSYPPSSGTLVYTSPTRTEGSFGNSTNNSTCIDNTQLTTIANTGNGATAKYTTTQTGVYEIRLNNITQNSNAELGQFRQFDVSITPDTNTLPNPTINKGRLWSFIWGFDADAFTEATATDANLYILVPGGFLGTNYVWQLNLNDFAGNVYELVANKRGVDSPNALGNPVSGLSVDFTNNSLSPQYRQYISYPDRSVIEPSIADVITINNYRFIDINGLNNTISPVATPGVKDSGFFKFQTNVNGTYAVIIDVDNDGNASNGYTPDGIFGVGDVFLRGETNANNEVIVPWNGKTNLGADLPDGTYQAKLQAIVGEYHFIAGDAESSGPTSTGLFIEKAFSHNSTSQVENYWDDITGLGGTSSGGTTSLPNGFVGGTGHKWGTTGSGGSFGDNTLGFGNLRYIDTYVYGKFTVAQTPIIIANSSDGNDFGDAPDTYGTNKDTSVGGIPASHIPSTILFLGTNAPDTDTDGQPNTTANGDDSNGTDDEDGIATFNNLSSVNTTYSTTVSLSNTTGGNAYLVGWIDFNRNGTFETSEGVSQTIANGATTATLNWTGLSGLSPGTTYARFRINKDLMTASNPTGVGTYGEVEDYALEIIPNIDYGDAPDTYGTNKDTSVGGVPASHIPSTTVRLGTTATDPDADGQPNTNADGDDNNTTDDENGVTLPTTLTTSSTGYSATVSFLKNTSSNIYLVGWIDFNRNGTFEASEGVAQTLTNAISTATRTTTLNWTGLSGLSPGTTYARFRISTTAITANNPTGTGNAGEVEDYTLTIASTTDYGDVPDTGTGTAAGNYKTTLSDDGARHTLVNGLRLGSQIDGDNGTLQNTAADADDTNGTDDEEGVTLPNTLTTEAGQTYTVPVNVTNSTGSNAFLVGYIDFNQDGDFLDTGETSATITVGTNAVTNPRSFNVTFTTPTGIVAGNSFARFRLSNTRTQAESSIGNSTSGEVEDYLLPISRTVSGKVWNDANGNIILSSNFEGNSNSNVFNEVATNTGSSSLTVYAVDGSGNVAGKATVDSNGTYKITGLAANTNYTLRLSNDNSKTIGQPTPSVSLPTGWTVTGENKNGTTETTTPGEIAIDAGTSSVINQDFGIFVPNANWNRDICTATPDMMLILDDSSSVDTTEVQQQRDGAMATIDYFINNNISARIAIVGFDSQKRTVINYTNVTAANRSLFVNALNTNYGVTGSGTNWPNGFQQAESLGLSSGQPDAVFFFTDGDSYGGGNAVTEANKFKVVGAHIYGIWIDDDTNLQLLDFQEITDGQNTIEFNGSNADVADYVKIDAYGQLAGNVTTLVQDFCPVNAVPPQLKLLKRITSVTRGGTNITPPNSQPFASFNEDGIVNNDDNNTKWPDSNSPTGNNSDTTNDYLKGAINGGQVIKDDVIEYTIYFLNTGGLDAANVKLCDQIPVNTTFLPDAFSTGQGISLALNNAGLPLTQNIIYTNDRTDADKGKYFPAGVEPTGCFRQTTPNVFVPITAADNVNGTISVEIPLVPDTTGQNPFAPNDAYGFIRFRAKVNPQ